MRKRRRFKKRTSHIVAKLSFLLFILLIFVLIFFSLKNGFLKIKQIEIQGNSLCVDENELKNYSGIIGQNFFLIKALKIEDNLRQKFFCIKSISVSKLFPDKVRLQISNREPLAMLAILETQEASESAFIENISTPSAQQVQDYYLVDSEGIVFSKGTDSLNIPQIFLSNSKISLGQKLANEVAGSIKILERIKTFGVEVKKSLIIGDSFLVNPNTSDQKIIFSLNDEIDVQLASLQLILDKAKINRGTIPPKGGTDLTELEFIDLRFDKPIVKFAPK